MGVTVFHVLSATTPDDPSYEIKPSNWNSAHSVSIDPFVISAGTNSTQAPASVVFSNSNGVSFGMNTNGVITATVVPGAAAGVAAIQAGTNTATSGTVSFSNLNGLTFGMNPSGVVTGSYTVPTQSVQTQASGDIARSGFTTTTVAGSVIAGTHDTAGLKLAVPAYITTFNQTNQTVASGNIAGTGFTTTTVAGSVVAGTNDTNGLKLAVPAYLTTQSVQTQASGNIVGSGFTSTTTAGTAVVGTLNSAGLSLGVPAYVTAAAGGGDGYNIIAVNGGATQLSSTYTLSNSNNVSFGLAAGVITATASYSQSTQSAIKGFGVSNTGQTAGNTGISSGVDWVIAGSNSITMSQSTAAGGPNTVWVQHPAWITTAMQSQSSSVFAKTGFTSTTTAGTAIVATHDTAGLSMGVPLFLTTAAQSSVSNVSGVLAATNNAAGGTATLSGNVSFSAANGLTFYTSAGNAIVGSYTVPTVTQYFSNTGTTFAGANISGSMTLNTNGLNMSLSAAAPGGGGGATLSYLNLPDEDMITNLSAHANGTMSIQNRLIREARTATQFVFPVNISSVATAANNSSAGINFSISMVIYSENANTLSSLSSTTFTTGATWTSNATASVTGAVFLTTPFNMNMSVGEYYFGLNMSTAATGGTLTGAATTSLGNTISIVGLNTAVYGAYSWHDLGAGTTQSTGWNEQGLYTGTTAITGPIQLGNISMAGTAAQRANFAALFKA